MEITFYDDRADVCDHTNHRFVYHHDHSYSLCLCIFVGLVIVDIGRDSHRVAFLRNCSNTASQPVDTLLGKMAADMDTFLAIDQFLGYTLDKRSFLAPTACVLKLMSSVFSYNYRIDIGIPDSSSFADRSESSVFFRFFFDTGLSLRMLSPELIELTLGERSFEESRFTMMPDLYFFNRLFCRSSSTSVADFTFVINLLRRSNVFNLRDDDVDEW